jgi:hypothetical protein
MALDVGDGYKDVAAGKRIPCVGNTSHGRIYLFPLLLVPHV